ncbi:hypothetical protein GCM10020366_55990 [Saccharopolyspora gregorii]|uniref:Uncharacterized protein n=1 Tax=Saccharopolyspora gregorii TaxID=33914 RepID=A0ABP6RYP3_9PSEU
MIGGGKTKCGPPSIPLPKVRTHPHALPDPSEHPVPECPPRPARSRGLGRDGRAAIPPRISPSAARCGSQLLPTRTQDTLAAGTRHPLNVG